jgi:chemotaxis signal transduction protein
MGQLGGSNIDMNSTKQSFSNLTEQLLNHLGMETLKKISREMKAKAQIAVDIVIRNLFERTADIGFLATDDDIRYFLTSEATRYEALYMENKQQLKKRFEEYVQKYSVYFDIVLMDTKGHILVNLDDTLSLSKSKDTIIEQVLNTTEDYVETFKYHDFVTKKKKSLVYSYKVTKTNEKDSEILGILSLCFKFSDEMNGIFKDLVNPYNQECITLLDKDGKVIASSDSYHIPLDAKLELVLNNKHKVISFGGRYYLSKTCSTNGYQGFMGLGWYGHIMIPLEYAFNSGDEDCDIKIDDSILQAILQHGDSFTKELKSIPLQAAQIQANLNRAVWNGNISQSKTKSGDRNFTRLLLSEIAKTGEDTKEIFNSSIINLTKTIILNDTVSIASLMIDIMDRNLYERANDCRWWALTSEFRNILDNDILKNEQREKLASILEYINELYTVYTNLFIYDKDGIIIAVSKKEQSHLIGRKLKNQWIEKTLMIKDSSKYCVSDFEPSDLYDNRYTYIYNSSIKSLKNEEQIVGGIGIVFDSQVELEAMINESMPRNIEGNIRDGLFGVYTTKDKMIISSSNKNYKVGNILDIDDKFFELKNGESKSEIITIDNNFYALGVKCSSGYREYKSSSDDYKNDVYSFFFSYISKADLPIDNTYIKKEFMKSSIKNEDSKEIATFRVGSKFLGAYAKDVVCALSAKDLETSITLNSDNYFKGTVIYDMMAISVLDISSFIQEETKSIYNEIIIINYENSDENHYVGLLVNTLEDIVDVPIKSIKPLEQHFINGGALIQSVAAIDTDGDNQLLTILDIKKLANELVA